MCRADQSEVEYMQLKDRILSLSKIKYCELSDGLEARIGEHVIVRNSEKGDMEKTKGMTRV